MKLFSEVFEQVYDRAPTQDELAQMVHAVRWLLDQGNAELAEPPTIRRGDRGADVKAWQEIVGVVADGDFGRVTEAATIAWQKTNMGPNAADGVVGPLTWKAARDLSDAHED